MNERTSTPRLSVRDNSSQSMRASVAPFSSAWKAFQVHARPSSSEAVTSVPSSLGLGKTIQRQSCFLGGLLEGGWEALEEWGRGSDSTPYAISPQLSPTASRGPTSLSQLSLYSQPKPDKAFLSPGSPYPPPQPHRQAAFL